MKILVFSDSHGNIDPMVLATEAEQPDLLLHLGDHDRDADVFSEKFPQIPLHVVKGNCDPASRSPTTDTIIVQGKKIIITHGHRYNVKLGYASIISMGLDAGGDILLFGHTHRAHYEIVEGMHVLNPGSAGMGSKKSCAVIELSEGEILCRHLLL